MNSKEDNLITSAIQVAANSPKIIKLLSELPEGGFLIFENINDYAISISKQINKQSIIIDGRKVNDIGCKIKTFSINIEDNNFMFVNYMNSFCGVCYDIYINNYDSGNKIKVFASTKDADYNFYFYTNSKFFGFMPLFRTQDFEKFKMLLKSEMINFI